MQLKYVFSKTFKKQFGRFRYKITQNQLQKTLERPFLPTYFFTNSFCNIFSEQTLSKRLSNSGILLCHLKFIKIYEFHLL